jgi:L-ribulose-5-phosphate 4-epimerase
MDPSFGEEVGMKLDELLERLALACRIIAMEGHNDIVWGHMSVRDPESPEHFWMKGHEVGLDEITPEDLVLVDLEGQKLAGARRRHSEYPIHSEIYRRRPEVQAVVHTHPVYGTIMASMEAELASITHEGSIFVPPPVPHFNLTTSLIRTREQGGSPGPAARGSSGLADAKSWGSSGSGRH